MSDTTVNKEDFYKETNKALDNFGNGNISYDFIKAYGEVKLSAIIASHKTDKKLSQEVYEIIITIIKNLINGNYNKDFVLPYKQGGAGTSINMHINEIIAYHSNLLLKENNINFYIDPIEHINIYQSTNDTFTTALTIMVYRHLLGIEEKIIKLQELLITYENKFNEILLTGRTEMQSALPITLGQVFGSYAGPIERDRWRLHKLKERIRNVAIGGTAIGTCFNAPQDYIFQVEKELRQITGLPICRSQNLPDEISNADKYGELASCYKLIALSFYKFTSDFLFYTSSDINEIINPDLQYGSTIMAAKTNPVIIEFIRGLSIDIQGEVFKIDNYVSNGNLQLNPFLPFILESFVNLNSGLTVMLDSFIDKFLKKIEINQAGMEDNLYSSNAVVNLLLPFLGYNRVKELYYKMKKEKILNREGFVSFLRTETALSVEDIEKILNPYSATSALKNKK